MKNLDVPNAAVSLVIKASLLVAQWSGRVRRRSLERLAAADADAKDKELLFLRDRVFQLETRLDLLLKTQITRASAPRLSQRLTQKKLEGAQLPCS